MQGWTKFLSIHYGNIQLRKALWDTPIRTWPVWLSCWNSGLEWEQVIANTSCGLQGEAQERDTNSVTLSQAGRIGVLGTHGGRCPWWGLRNFSGGKLAISKRWDSQKGSPAGSGEVGDEILQYPLTWTHMECTWQEDGPAHLRGNCTYRL